MDNIAKDKKALKLFFLILIPASIILEGLYIFCKNPFVMLMLMWAPGVSGIIVSNKYYKKENILGIRPCKIRYILFGILCPVIYLAVSYKIAWAALGDQTIGTHELAVTLGMADDGKMSAPVYIAVALVINFLSSCASSTGEELGWRGFLYPALERVSGRTKALAYSGSIWAVWHMPIIIAGIYQARTGLGYGLLMFAVCTISMSIIMSWTRNVSSSVIPAIMIHASHNLFDQTVFQPLSTNSKIAYYAGEQGFITLFLLVAIVAAVLLLWNKGKSKSVEHVK